MKLAEGSVFAGRYRVLRAIAQGGMGAVYEVVHIETDRRRALKVMRPEIVGNEDMKRRFRQEAKVAARIDSDYIVDVPDAGIDGETGLPFLVMELLDGEELAVAIGRNGRLDASEALLYLEQVAQALDRSHAVQVVHRDLKPENIFVVRRSDGKKQIKILDFGIAKVLEGTVHGKATRNLGTPLYMAPEQFKPGATITPKTDVFALAMVSYTLLVGQIYWYDEAKEQGNVFEFAKMAMQGPTESAVARAARRGVELPAAFADWFAKHTQLEPSLRGETAGTCIAELRALFMPQLAQAIAAVSADAVATASTTAASSMVAGGAEHPAAVLAQTAPAPAQPTAAPVRSISPATSQQVASPLPLAATQPATAPTDATLQSPASAAPHSAAHWQAGQTAPIANSPVGSMQPHAGSLAPGIPDGGRLASAGVTAEPANQKQWLAGVAAVAAFVVFFVLPIVVYFSMGSEPEPPPKVVLPPAKVNVQAAGEGGGTAAADSDSKEEASDPSAGASSRQGIRPASPKPAQPTAPQPPSQPQPQPPSQPVPPPATQPPAPEPTPTPASGAGNRPKRPRPWGGKGPRKRRRRRRIIRR